MFKECGYSISAHELRHTYASKLISAGATYEQAAEALGHTPEETARTYSHLNKDTRKQLKELITKIF